MSTRTCDNETDMNLAVMTYLYTEHTWYGKNFGAYISPSSKPQFTAILTRFADAKKIPWDDVKETITHCDTLPYINGELKELYERAGTWKEFFAPIVERIKIAGFCDFISGWIDAFMLKYFSNLQDLVFLLPVIVHRLHYEVKEYKEGGRRITQKSTRKVSRDYH